MKSMSDVPCFENKTIRHMYNVKLYTVLHSVLCVLFVIVQTT